MAFNGTANGTIAYGTGQTGFGQCLSLAGTGYVSLTSVTAGTTATGQTAEGWFKSTSATGGPFVIIGNNGGFFVGLSAAKLKFAWNSVTQSFSTAVSYNDGNWHHFAMVWDTAGNLLCFVDGVLLSTSTAGATRPNPTQIGAYGGSFNWNGSLDNIVWTKSPKYTANFTPPAAPVGNSNPNQIAIWNFEGDLTDANVVYTAPVPGILSRTARTLTTQTIATTAATGGTPPFTYQFQRSTDNVTYTNIGSAGTTLSYADSGLTANTGYWYRVLITDSAAATAFVTAGLYSTKDYAGQYRLYIGDSITAGYQLTAGQAPPDNVNRYSKVFNLNAATQRNIEYANSAVVGSATSNWVSGQGNMNVALAAGASVGATIAHVMLGTNDSTFDVTLSAYTSQLTNIVNTLLSNGYTVILSYPPYPNDGRSAARQALLVSYQGAIDSLINGSTVLQGDKKAYGIFQANAAAYTSGGAGSFFQADGLHPNAEGAQVLAMLWFTPINNYAGIVGGGSNRGLSI